MSVIDCEQPGPDTDIAIATGCEKRNPLHVQASPAAQASASTLSMTVSSMS
jgi:hypothetical protein